MDINHVICGNFIPEEAKIEYNAEIQVVSIEYVFDTFY